MDALAAALTFLLYAAGIYLLFIVVVLLIMAGVFVWIFRKP